MYKAAAALKTFLQGFGIPAYQEGTVPEDQDLPYITYSLQQPEWNQKATMYVRVWDRSTSNAFIVSLADQITAAIGEMKRFSFDGGYLVVWPETPLIQILVDGDYRNAYINLSVNSYQKPGV